MAQITFKNFLTFVDHEGEMTDEQICEIFGIFRNNAKVDALRKQKAELAAKRSEEQKKKDAIFAKRKADLAAADAENGGYNPKERGSLTARSQQAQGRAAERDWLANLRTEQLREFRETVDGEPDIPTFSLDDLIDAYEASGYNLEPHERASFLDRKYIGFKDKGKRREYHFVIFCKNDSEEGEYYLTDLFVERDKKGVAKAEPSGMPFKSGSKAAMRKEFKAIKPK